MKQNYVEAWSFPWGNKKQKLCAYQSKCEANLMLQKPIFKTTMGGVTWLGRFTVEEVKRRVGMKIMKDRVDEKF